MLIAYIYIRILNFKPQRVDSIGCYTLVPRLVFHNNIIIRLFNSAANNENISDAESIENKKNKQRFYIFIK